MTDLVVLGAGGDLAGRYLLPAVAELQAAGRFPADCRVVGVDRQGWDSEEFRSRVGDRLHRYGVTGAAITTLLGRLEYRWCDVTDAEGLRDALAPHMAPLVAYLALPPAVFSAAVEALAALPLPSGSRVVVEKPFGEDLESARALNRLLHRSFAEEAVFRVDHFLGKQTVQNVLGLRFANRLFEPVWNNQHVERVEIVWDETIALEGRAGYYDRAGALKDMIQNHLLQLLCLVAMEPPAVLDERGLRDRKVDVLRAVHRLLPEEVSTRTARARYEAGVVDDVDVASYVDEPGVDPSRGTETFAAVELHVDNWRWAGVPFLLRTGKALAADRRAMHVQFRPVPHLAFGAGDRPQPNLLTLAMDPDRVAVDISLNGAGDPFWLEPVELVVDLAPQQLSAYARVLLDVLEGEPTFTIRDDEAEESWRIVEPVLAGWADGLAPLATYRAGTAGPDPHAKA